MEYFTMQCHFCKHEIDRFEPKSGSQPILYHCPGCGDVKMTRGAFDDFEGELYSDNQKKILIIVFRNEYERRNKKPPETPATLDDLHRYENTGL